MDADAKSTQDEGEQNGEKSKRRVAAITGAGSGIGRALATGLALRGFDLALSDVSQAGLNATAASLTHAGVKVTTSIVDVADRQAMEAWAKEVVDTFGQINMVFNNAGVTVVDSVEHISTENFRWLMDINFWGVVNGTQSFLPYLREVEQAHIINTSSIFGVVASARQAAYNASKFAVRGFTEALSQELADTHIKVSCILPGGIKTKIVDHSRYYAEDNETPTHEEMSEQFRRDAALLPREAASIILHGIEKGDSHILVGNDAKAMALGQRLMPRRYPLIIKLLRWLSGSRAEKAKLKESG